MILAMTSVTFRGNTIREVFDYAKKTGIEGIEWGICDNHMQLLSEERAKEINDLSVQYGIKTCSLGSYCYMDNIDEIINIIETAKMINAPIIRVWAGRKGSNDCSCEEYQEIVTNTIAMAERAKRFGIKIGFEYHGHSLTDTADSAVKLVKDIAGDNVGLYWQPDASLSLEDNIGKLNKIKPCLIGNLHIHNYTPEGGYMPLSDIEDSMRAYYSDIKDKDYSVMIEFTKDGSFENFADDVYSLKRVIK